MEDKNFSEASNEYEMLKGNINRMFITKSKSEFDSRVAYAKRNLDVLISILEKKFYNESSGYWIINSDGYYPQCSECGAEPKEGKKTAICECCGAKMDKGMENGKI